MIKFLLNNTEYQLSAVDPQRSVLDFLREELQQTGTKEGCASGDCGACTVVVGEVIDDTLRYRAINACITPIVTLQGKQLLTVEHLQQGDSLHPVQQAMVDNHGSQCGFCTPGFIMSMFAYRKNHRQPERASIIEALGGNLCRCTGYRPIIDAAIKMYEPPLDDQFSVTEADVVRALQAMAADCDKSGVALQHQGKRYFSPTTSAALAALLSAYPDAKLLAGGTDLCLEFTQSLRLFEVLIYTGRIAEMLQVTDTGSALEIGAAVSYSACADKLVNYYPDLEELLGRLGSLQIRNQGTLGGNVANASPIGDMPPVLIALDAQLLLRCTANSRLLPVEEYFVSYKVTALKPAEFIERIVLPKPRAGYVFRVYKTSKRWDDDISACCGAFYVRVEAGRVADARIAFGGMAEISARARQCEQALIGKAWEMPTIDAAMAALASDFQPISDFRASADYRLTVAQNMIKRFYWELESPTAQLRLSDYG